MIARARAIIGHAARAIECFPGTRPSEAVLVCRSENGVNLGAESQRSTPRSLPTSTARSVRSSSQLMSSSVKDQFNSLQAQGFPSSVSSHEKGREQKPPGVDQPIPRPGGFANFLRDPLTSCFRLNEVAA